MLDQVFQDVGHHLYIRRLPGPCPRLLPGFYLQFPWDLQISEGETFQKPNRKNNEIMNNVKTVKNLNEFANLVQQF